MILHALLFGVLATTQNTLTTQATVTTGAWADYVAAEERTTAEPHSADAWIALGDSLIAVADTGDYGAAGIWWEDARGAYEKALAADPLSVDAVEALFDVAVALDNDERVVSFGERLVGARLTEWGEAPPDVLAEVLRSRARLPRPAPDVDPAGHAAALEDLSGRLESFRRLAPGAPELALARSDVLADLGQRDRAFVELATGLSAAPDSIDLHGAFIGRAVADGRRPDAAATYDRLAHEHPAEALVWWYRGSLQLLIAEDAVSERRFGAARLSVGRARGWLSRCADLEAAYAEAVRRSQARARALIGWCAFGEEDMNGASAEWLDVLTTDPDLRAEPDGLGRSVLDGLALLGAEHNRAATYTEGTELCRAVVAVQPDDGEWWNNLAFFLRQRGAQEAAGFVEVSGDPEVISQATFRESWEAYLRAIGFATDDVRILNDCALIQIYHLQDEVERAEEMLHRAIAMGEEQLAGLGRFASESETFPVAQAVGDAWENLGYAAYHLHGDPEAARAFFEKSLATDSGFRPAVDEFIQVIDGAIDGEIPALEERPAASDARPLVEAHHGGVRPAWGWSYDDARASSAAEGRFFVVYHRGEGLGLIVPWFDEVVVRPDVVDRLADVVCVLADASRHTALDRTARGDMIPCPRFGGPPCGVHVANAEAFAEEWRSEHDGAEPGEEEETMFVRGPDGEPLGEEINDWFMALIGEAEGAEEAWRAVLGEPVGGADLRRLLDALPSPGGDAELAAQQLLVDATPGARVAAESLLLAPTTDATVRRQLVAALANREELDLLGALCARVDDPQLVAMALDAWPVLEDPAPLIDAMLFAPGRPLRLRAAHALGRVDPGSRTRELLVARRLLGDEDDRLIAAEALGRLEAAGGAR